MSTVQLQTIAVKLLLGLVAGLSLQASIAQTASKSTGTRVAIASMTCVGQPFVCKTVEISAWLFISSKARSAVVINHGSQGIDQRMFEYVDALNTADIGAVLLDHWTARGFSDTHSNYARTELLGGSPLLQAIDTVLTIDALKNSHPHLLKFGSIGESLGGGTTQQLAKTWIYPMIDEQASRLYSRPFKVQVPDALVGMYGHCGHRRNGERFITKPILLITGELDDETPSKLCEQYIPWMNGRGGQAEIAVLPGVGHSFDAPYARKYIREKQFAQCDFLVNGNQVTLASTGETVVNTPANYANLREKCSAVGFHSGYVGDRHVAVPLWMGFFKRHLQ